MYMKHLYHLRLDPYGGCTYTFIKVIKSRPELSSQRPITERIDSRRLREDGGTRNCMNQARESNNGLGAHRRTWRDPLSRAQKTAREARSDETTRNITRRGERYHVHSPTSALA